MHHMFPLFLILIGFVIVLAAASGRGDRREPPVIVTGRGRCNRRCCDCDEGD